VNFVGDPDAIEIARAGHLSGECNACGRGASGEGELFEAFAGAGVARFGFDDYAVTHFAGGVSENVNGAGIGGKSESQAVTGGDTARAHGGDTRRRRRSG